MIKIGQKSYENPTIRAYPGLGTATRDGKFRISLGGVAVDEVDRLSLKQRMIIRMFAGVMKATSADLENPIFKSRVTPFVLKGIGQQRLAVRIGGKSFDLDKRTKKNGQFQESIELDSCFVSKSTQPHLKGAGIVPYEIFLQDFPEVVAQGMINVIERRGMSVISDIDDTIKETSVGNRNELLANTFLREFQIIDGMPELYRTWANHGACFHYVSSSPWQLFEPLLEMNIANQLPLGSFHLKNFRIRDQFFKKVAFRSRGKSTSIRILLDFFPERQFVLIGDSGEKDPEIYSKICRQYPDQIQGVFIRELPHRPLNEARANRLRQCLAKGRMGAFHTATELEEMTSSFVNELGQ